VSSRLRAGVVLAALAVIAACGGSSSGGSPASSPTPTGTTGIDRAAVGTALGDVLTGLTTVQGITRQTSINDAAGALQDASAGLKTAADTLTAGPQGVPSAVSEPVATGLARASALLGQAATCLTDEVATKHPDTTKCVPPLRQAEVKNAALARALITLSAYGTESPKTFESDLVAALGGS
jgi:hypothetical protein